MNERNDATETAPGDQPVATDPAAGPSSGRVEITHANQLRGARFKALIRRPVAWVPITVIALLALIFLAAAGIPAIGGAAFVVVALIGVLVVFLIADNQAEDAFYDSYCESHRLTRIANPAIGTLTPLLRKGDERKTDEIFRGELAPGIEGDLVLFTYTEVTRDSDGDRQETDFPYTLVHVEMPEIIPHMPELRVQNQFGFKFLEGFEDSFRRKHERVTLESEKLGDRYEIFVLKAQDQIWVRRLFSPSFIVWLVGGPPEMFAFELENGHLVAYVPRHIEDSGGLEEVTRAGTYVARRLLDEVAETSTRAEPETP